MEIIEAIKLPMRLILLFAAVWFGSISAIHEKGWSRFHLSFSTLITVCLTNYWVDLFFFMAEYNPQIIFSLLIIELFLLLFILSSIYAAINPVNRFVNASGEGNFQKVKRYIDRGGDVNAREYNQSFPLLFLFFQKKGKSVKNNYDNSFYGDTALTYAVKNGHYEVAKLLLDSGANINSTSVENYTLLQSALAGNNIEVLSLLIERGVDINEVGFRGITALHHLADRGFDDETFAVTASLLLQHGADVNARSDRGLTPLHYFACRGKCKTCELLLNKGAEVNARTLDENPKTPLFYAIRENHTDIIDLIKSFGGVTF